MSYGVRLSNIAIDMKIISPGNISGILSGAGNPSSNGNNNVQESPLVQASQLIIVKRRLYRAHYFLFASLAFYNLSNKDHLLWMYLSLLL